MVLVSRKISLNCLLISISGKSTWIELDEGRQDEQKTSFYFFMLIDCTVFYHHHY